MPIDYESVKAQAAGTKLASIYKYLDEILPDYTHSAQHNFKPMTDRFEFTVYMTIGKTRFRSDIEFPSSTFVNVEESIMLFPETELTDKEKLAIMSGLFDGVAWALERTP
jgi:hypothetical protein